MHISRLARRALAAERILVGGRSLQRRHDALHGVLAETGADHADKGQMVTAVYPRHQRSEFTVGCLPTSQHDLMAGPAFRLGPVSSAPRAIGGAELLGNDSLERQLACRFEDRVTAAFEVLDIADRFGFALP